MVSFTGKFDANFLKQVDEPIHTDATKPLTEKAHTARDLLRKASSLKRQLNKGRNYFTPREKLLLRDLEAGHLHDAANAATLRSGWGRIKYQDGTIEDITPNGGGIVRRVLDNHTPGVDLSLIHI